MSNATQHLEGPIGRRTRSCATELVCRDCGYRTPLLDQAFKCPACGEGLDIDYDYERAKETIAEHGFTDRPWNVWRLEELLPITSADAQARVAQFAGQTPLIKADRLGAELGLKNLYLKDDSTNRPSLSYKDRVVGMAIARLLELGKDEVGCVSTGNVGTAVAALAAKAGAQAYVFYPGNMEKGKAKACRALGAQVCQLDGNYDQANRACRELSLASGIEFANITLRPFYAEGAKTVAFEVVEELGWVSPDHFVIPAAGGTLSSRVHKGLNELEMVGLAETSGTKINIAQAGGCNPIATAILEGGELEPQSPDTAVHSLAIGAPGDGEQAMVMGLVMIGSIETSGSDVSLDDVTKVYPDGTPAVRGLDLRVDDGEFMVFVGPSGCGKTTALRMVAGLEDISAGEVRIGDRVVNRVPSKDREREKE